MSRIRVNCVQCQDCGDIIFSRARHDYHGCSCGKTTVDGGLDYLRYCWGTKRKPKTLIKYVESSRGELYNDWNFRRDKFGVIQENVEWNIKIGDIVRTNKGCRIKGCFGELIVLEVGKKWRNFNAVICKKSDGRKSMFLSRNLTLIRRG